MLAFERRCYLRALAALLLSAALTGASAQDAVQSEANAGMDESQGTTLPRISVEEDVELDADQGPKRTRGAMRTDTPLIEVPQAISVITQAQITDQNAQNMQEVLRYSAGVRAEMYGLDNRGDWFSLRGGSEGSTLLDGLRLPLSGWYGNVRNEPFAFERVEVMRGPSSVIAGQNGPGGVVNLISKQPQAEAWRELQLQGGSYDSWQAALDMTGTANDSGTLLYRLVGLAHEGGTQVDHTDEERQFIAPSITWLATDKATLTVRAEYQNDESNNNVGFFPWEGMLLPAPNGRIPVETFIGEPDWDTYSGERSRIAYKFEYRPNDAWSIRQNFRYDDVSGTLRGMYANFWEGLLPDDRSVNRTWYVSETDTRVTNANLEAEGHLRFGDIEHTLFFAIDGVRTRETNPNTGGEATPLDVYTPIYGTFPLPDFELDAGPEMRVEQIGFSVQDQVRVNDRWVVVGSLRQDYSETEVDDAPDGGADDNALTGRFGVVYLADGGWAPYASYSESFEPVLGTDREGSVFRPKRGEQVEVGLRWQPPDQRVLVAAAAYRLVENNSLTSDPVDPNYSVQRGEVTVDGAELEANADVGPWSLTASYAYTDATQTGSGDPNDPYLGKRFASIPEHSASLWAVLNFRLFGVDGFRAGAGVRYVGETWDGLDQLRTPSNTLYDAMLSYENGHWRYALNASNLTDEIYFATCLDRGDCWFGPRREVTASLSYLW